MVGKINNPVWYSTQDQKSGFALSSARPVGSTFAFSRVVVIAFFLLGNRATTSPCRRALEGFLPLRCSIRETALSFARLVWGPPLVSWVLLPLLWNRFVPSWGGRAFLVQEVDLACFQTLLQRCLGAVPQHQG